MVVVTMRYEHRIDGRQFIKGNSGFIYALWPGKRERRASLGPDGIYQDVAAGRLKEPACMANEAEARFVTIHARWRRIRKIARCLLGPSRRLAGDSPAQNGCEALKRNTVGIEKVLTVEMIGSRTSIRFHAWGQRAVSLRNPAIALLRVASATRLVLAKSKPPLSQKRRTNCRQTHEQEARPLETGH
jgi:hypothetical protein